MYCCEGKNLIGGNDEGKLWPLKVVETAALIGTKKVLTKNFSPKISGGAE
jgi:hypothetical protein